MAKLYPWSVCQINYTYLYATDATCASSSSVTNGLELGNTFLSCPFFRHCCEKFWLMNVASRPRFVGELIPFPSSKATSCAVSLTVSKSKNTEKSMVHNPFGWGDLQMLTNPKDLKPMVEKMWIKYMKQVLKQYFQRP